jgi:hypothetical protein
LPIVVIAVAPSIAPPVVVVIAVAAPIAPPVVVIVVGATPGPLLRRILPSQGFIFAQKFPPDVRGIVPVSRKPEPLFHVRWQSLSEGRRRRRSQDQQHRCREAERANTH